MRYVIEKNRPCHLSRTYRPSQLLCSIEETINENWLSLVGSLLTQFEVIVKGGAESNSKNSFAHYRVTTSIKVLYKAALKPLRHPNLAELKIPFIYDAMFGLFARVPTSGRNYFQARRSKNQIRSFFPVLISYYCNITDAKDMSAVNRGIATHTPSVRCPSTMTIARNL